VLAVLRIEDEQLAQVLWLRWVARPTDVSLTDPVCPRHYERDQVIVHDDERSRLRDVRNVPTARLRLPVTWFGHHGAPIKFAHSVGFEPTHGKLTACVSATARVNALLLYYNVKTNLLEIFST